MARMRAGTATRTARGIAALANGNGDVGMDLSFRGGRVDGEEIFGLGGGRQVGHVVPDRVEAPDGELAGRGPRGGGGDGERRRLHLVAVGSDGGDVKLVEPRLTGIEVDLQVDRGSR